jgi:hypothetical protein
MIPCVKEAATGRRPRACIPVLTSCMCLCRMQAVWLLALLACACGVSADSLPYGERSFRSLPDCVTLRLTPGLLAL